MTVVKWLVVVLLVLLAVVCACMPQIIQAAFFLPRCLRGREKPRLYGVRAYVGSVGSGKTISAVREVCRLRKRFPNATVYSNASLRGAKPLETYADVAALWGCDTPVIILWDELGVNLNARAWNESPLELLSLIAQNRKGAGVRLIYTAQDYSMVDKQLRVLTNDVILCQSVLGRLIFCYPAKSISPINGTFRRGIRGECYDSLPYRKEYDTYEFVAKIVNSRQRSAD